MRLSFITPAIGYARRRTDHPERQGISLDQQVSTTKPDKWGRPGRITLIFFTDGMVHACACGPSRPRTELLNAQYLDSAVDRDETSNAVKFDLGRLLKQ